MHRNCITPKAVAARNKKFCSIFERFMESARINGRYQPQLSEYGHWKGHLWLYLWTIVIKSCGLKVHWRRKKTLIKYLKSPRRFFVSRTWNLWPIITTTLHHAGQNFFAWLRSKITARSIKLNVTNLKVSIIKRRLIVSIIRSMDRLMNVSHRVKSDRSQSWNRRARKCSRKLAWLMKEFRFPASAFGVQLQWFWLCFPSSANRKVNYFEYERRPRAPMGTNRRRSRRFWSEFTRDFLFCFMVQWKSTKLHVVGLARVFALRFPMGVKKKIWECSTNFSSR